MGRSDRDGLLAIVDAVTAIRSSRTWRPNDGLVFDAVRARLMEIGEAVKDVDAALLATRPSIPWKKVAAMRDQLAHRYFDTSHSIVAHTVSHDLVELLAATNALLATVDDRGSDLPTAVADPRGQGPGVLEM